MARSAEVSARRDIGENLSITIHEVGNADHRCARTFGELAPVTVEAAVGLEGELIIIDRMRNNGRLLW
jgi:hypothetical protein